jgi:hypothetical protein
MGYQAFASVDDVITGHRPLNINSRGSMRELIRDDE